MGTSIKEADLKQVLVLSMTKTQQCSKQLQMSVMVQHQLEKLIKNDVEVIKPFQHLFEITEENHITDMRHAKCVC